MNPTTERRITGRAASGLTVALLAVSFSSALLAVSSQTWRQREKSEFETGEPRGVALAADGSLRLARRLDLLYESPLPFIWALAQDASGAFYAAGGNEGVIERIEPSGRHATYARIEEPEVQALAADRSGNLYAAGVPGGRIYKFAPGGRQAWSYDTQEEYVWALAAGRDGRLYAGTGPDGRILEIDAGGRGSVLFDSAETHIRTLLLDDDGTLYAGTDGSGLVFRVSGRGRGFVLYDAPLGEVTALARGRDGTLYAAVVGESGRQRARGERGAPRPTATPPPAPAPPAEGAPSQPSAPPPGAVEQAAAQEQKVPITMEGKVIAISAQGYGREIWSGSQEAILSLAVDPDGRLLLGSSLQGKIYALEASDELSEIARIGSSQVTALLRGAGGEVAVAGSNFGALSLLRPGHAAQGIFESRVLDARAFATWGRAIWRADSPKGTRVSLSARSGNTEDPDPTWSDWSAALEDPSGTLVDLPVARFLQWRATLATDDAARTPVLQEVAITYLQANLPPEFRTIEVQAPGVAFQSVPGSQGGSPQEARQGGPSQGDVQGAARRRGGMQTRRGFEPGAQSVTWQAADPNDDELTYDVDFRALDETTWKPLRRGIQEEFVTLEGSSLPDGTYLLRLVASDAASNPAGQALTAVAISSPFDVDTTPPRVEELEARVRAPSLRVTFTARDGFSIVREAAYSVDAGEWIPVQPIDRLHDTPVERYDLTLPTPPRGEHTFVVRVTDAAGNVGAGRAVITVP